MKIGIMTFHWAANHGALLQTYALQKTLTDIIPGSEVCIVDYKPARYDMSLKKAIRSRRLRVIKNNLKDIKKNTILAPFQNGFPKTYRYYSTEQLMRRPPDCDIFIAGSDQIWNESYTMNGEGTPTPAYYLPFHPGSKHISYAASFGTTQLKTDVQTYILPYLQKLDAVSVREKTGKAILDQMGIPCEIVCDPSALLPCADYHALARSAFSGDYISTYFLRSQSPVAASAIKYFSKKCKVQDVSLLPMDQWLGGIGEAKFLLTNSFHGMMVALKMHVPFAVFLSDGALSGMNDRFYTILEVLGLTDRILTEDNPIQAVEAKSICWEQVDRQMEIYAADSVAFLKKHCTAPRLSGPIAHYRNAQCCGCTACEQICPKQCIQMVQDGEGFLYPHVDADHCIRCGKCIRVCPIKNNPMAESGMPVAQAWVARAQEPELVQNSSSGGVFSVLAQHILDRQGVVFAVTMSDDCKQAIYTKAENSMQLASMRGSKYVQSSKNDVFLQVKQALEAGRQVLFCGTPCDVNGLYNYLKKTNTAMDKLLLVDFICHGVPSPLVWERYVELRQKQMGDSARNVQFRNKRLGWKNFSLTMVFSKGKTYSAHKDKDPFLRGFLTDLYLRPSCHECAAKGENRVSDITIGDAWGLDNIIGSDDKGVSAIMIHTPKAQTLISDLKDQFQYVRFEDAQAVVAGNSAMLYSSAMNGNRQRFMAQLLNAKRIDRLILKNCRDPFVLAVKKRTKQLIRGLK